MGNGKNEKKQRKTLAKIEKKKLENEAKRIKAEAKLVKKRIEAGLPQDGSAPAPPPRASVGVRYANTVRGVLYLVLGISLIGALVLGQQNLVVSLDDIVRNLFVATAGKIVLGLISVALVIYGLKKLGVVR